VNAFEVQFPEVGEQREVPDAAFLAFRLTPPSRTNRLFLQDRLPQRSSSDKIITVFTDAFKGYVRTFAELMEETDWDSYGTGNYEKCADCMVHCGYEATAVNDTFAHPLKALGVALRGPRADGPMAPEIPLDGQRPAEFVFEGLVKPNFNSTI